MTKHFGINLGLKAIKYSAVVALTAASLFGVAKASAENFTLISGWPQKLPPSMNKWVHGSLSW